MYCYMSHYDFSEVSEIYWVVRTRDQIAPLVSKLFPHIKQFTTFDFEGTSRKGFYCAEICPFDIPDGVEERSPHKLETLKPDNWHLCPLLTNHLADITIELPDRYCLLQPYTLSNTIPGRDFTPKDWENALKLLDYYGLKGVILDTSRFPVPEDDRLINLQGKTPDLAEAIQIAKGAECFVGIDSSFSILMSQLLDKDHLHIKCINSWMYNVREVYFAPHKNFDFVKYQI